MAVTLRSKKSSSGILSRLRQDAVAIAYAAIGVFIGLALATYHSSDPSFNSTGSELVAKNACGFVGSFLSDLLYQGFGAGAWLFVAGAVRLSWLTFRGKTGNAFARVAWGFAFVVAASALLSLHFSNQAFFQGQMSIGGVIGALVVRGLVTVFNSMGVAVILWAVVLILAVFYSGKPVVDWLQSLGSGLRLTISASGRIVRYVIKLLSEIPLSLPTFRSESKTKAALIKTEPLAVSPPPQEIPLIDEVVHDEPALEQEPNEKPRLIKRRSVRLQAKINRRVENWKLPDLSILDDPPATRMKIDKREIEEKAEIIVDKLSKFAVNGEVVAAKSGPAVTLFEFRPNADVQLTSITNRADDLALALSAESLRIIAPIPGRDVVGIETSNAHRETVYLKDILADAKFWKEETALPVCLGREVDGTPRVVDLRSMPHMMVAGQTGSGKSVFVVSSITGFVFRHSPKTLRIVLIDPKQVDLTLFSNIPHLLMPPICEPRKAVIALRWGVREMEKRNRSFNRFKVRKLEEFNEAVAKLSKEQIEEHTQINSDLEAQNRKNETYYYTSQPFIVYVIEEFGDLMMVDKQHVEEGVVRLTQMARAAGIHLILAMQTPRKEIVTGRIKTNIPGRVSFKVPGFLDSKIILDEKGAERLLGRGDMLFLSPGVSKPQRHHAPWLTNEEIERVVKTWSDQAEPQFDELALKALEGNRESDDSSGFGADSGVGGFLEDDGQVDEMYDRVLAWVAAQKTVSASLIQRKFGLGYPRASRLVDQFESQGVIGPSNGSKPRQVLVQPMPEP